MTVASYWPVMTSMALTRQVLEKIKERCDALREGGRHPGDFDLSEAAAFYPLQRLIGDASTTGQPKSDLPR